MSNGRTSLSARRRSLLAPLLQLCVAFLLVGCLFVLSYSSQPNGAPRCKVVACFSQTVRKGGERIVPAQITARVPTTSPVAWASYLPLVIANWPPRMEAAPFAETLIPDGAQWKYRDDDVDPGVTWRLRSFDDSGWQSGPAELGYGDGDEATIVGCGNGATDCVRSAATIYFRHAFTVSNAAEFTLVDLLLRRDDGVIVYLNDQEIVRNNMPTSAVTHTTPAVASVFGLDESQIYHYAVDPALLLTGKNVVAAEVHQVSSTSSDITFDLALGGTRSNTGAFRFAAIGDYGNGSRDETAVAQLLKSWQPDFVITLGDNNYPIGAQETITRNIDYDYGEFVHSGRFFPALGNHDWMTKSAQAYFDYFDLPGNERYYDFVRGDLHFFVLDSDPHEPDFITDPVANMNSAQGRWLQAGLAASTARWKIVYFHHAPYSSSVHGSSESDPHIYMRWPFAAWGACAVLAGHDHVYERLSIDGIPNFVNGLGGVSQYDWHTIQPSSQLRFNSDNGAMLISASAQHITFQFITQANALIDTFSLGPDDCQTSAIG